MLALRPYRTQVGVSLRPDGIDAVSVRRTLGGKIAGVRRVTQAINPGLLRASPFEPNIDKIAELAEALRTALRPLRARTVALSVPDACASIAIFPFQSLPAGPHELDALLRWRFEQEAHRPVGDASIKCRVFPVPDKIPPETFGEGPVAAYVLAVAIKGSVLRQYQTLCEQAGVVPLSIGCASLQLFDLCRSAGVLARETFFSTWTPDRLLFLAVQNGLPVFLRTQRVRGNAVLREALRSCLQCFDDRFPHADVAPDTSPSPLYLLGEMNGQEMELSTEEEVWSPIGLHWRVRVHRDWPELAGVTAALSGFSMGGCCALASTHVA